MAFALKDKIVKLEAKIKELTEEYNRIKNDLGISVIEKNKLITEISKLKNEIGKEKGANKGLSTKLSQSDSIITRLKEKLTHPFDNLTNGNGVLVERTSFLGVGAVRAQVNAKAGLPR